MSSILEKNAGLFNPALRFAFTNITEEVFVSAWNGSPITVKPGQTVELTHHLAVKLTDELVDKIMIGNAKIDEVSHYERNPGIAPNSYRAASSLGVPAARKVWEDQIVRQLEVDEESPEMQVMRAEIRAELQADMSQEKTSEPVHVPSSIEEFAELKEGGLQEKPLEKKPLKVKTIKK